MIGIAYGKMFALQTKLNEMIFVSGGYEEFSALYPFLRTQKIIFMPKVRIILYTFWGFSEI